MKYIYKTYRLTIDSEISLPELPQSNRNGQDAAQSGQQGIVQIRLGAVPELLDDPIG